MPEALVVQPPLCVPRGYVDYPYLTNLGVYQAAAVLAAHGVASEVLDAFAMDGAGWELEEGHAWLGAPRAQFLQELARSSADVVIVAASPFALAPSARPWLAEVVATARVCARRGVVLAELYQGGMHYVEYEPRALLEEVAGVDLLMRYECEVLLARLAEGLSRGGSIPRGIWENHDPFSLEPIPAPAFELACAEEYFVFLERVLGARWRPGPFSPRPRRTLPLVTARGCPHGCTFCSKNPGLPAPRRQLRSVPLRRVEEWLTSWRRQLGLERIVVLDEIVNIDRDRFDALLTCCERLGLRLELPNGLRADRITREQVRRLRNLTSRLKVSLESASPRVQREVIDKRLAPESVEEVARWCAEVGLPLDVHCLFGVPGETPEELRATLESMLGLVRAYRVRPLAQRPVPLPGTRLYEELTAAGWSPPPAWEPEQAFEHPELVGDVGASALAREACWLLSRELRPATRKVIVNLTYRCNNRCSFCAVGDRPAVDATAADVAAALERYRDAGYDQVDFDGGEPTLHPHLPALVRRAKALGYTNLTLITNGRRLSYRDYAAHLASAGLDQVLVSLHAAEAERHEEVTRVPGSFAQTRAGIVNAIAVFGRQRVGVNTTLAEELHASAPALGIWLAELGVRCWNLQLVTPFGRGASAAPPAPAAIERVLEQVFAARPSSLAVNLVNCPPCLAPGHERSACGDFAKALRDMVFVGASGQNLQAYLAGRRRHGPRCGSCLYSVLCPGEYAFDVEPRPAFVDAAAR